MYSRNLFVLDFARSFFVSCAQIFEAYAVRTLIKFGCGWRKIGRKSRCMKDSESTYCFFGHSSFSVNDPSQKALCSQRASFPYFTLLFKQLERTLQRNDPVKYRIFFGAVLAVCTEITVSHKLETIITFRLCKSRFAVAFL